MLRGRVALERLTRHGWKQTLIEHATSVEVNLQVYTLALHTVRLNIATAPLSYKLYTRVLVHSDLPITTLTGRRKSVFKYLCLNISRHFSTHKRLCKCELFYTIPTCLYAQ
jgi:hypothetical protein